VRVLLVAGLVFLLGCASVDSRRVSELSIPSPSDRPNPLNGQGDALRAGRKLFRRHCADCHGGDADGRPWAPSLRTAVVSSSTDAQLESFLRNGALTRGMPSWSGLPELQRWQLVSYLKSLH
jgi:mono/diheme cytochrome c family protein